METKYFKHINVNPDGTFWDGTKGAVRTDKGISMSQENGGCGLDGCGCSEGHWLCITKGRTEDGVIEGKTIHFKNKREMNEFLDDINAISNLRENW